MAGWSWSWEGASGFTTVVCVTCRDEVLTAFEASVRETGRAEFTPNEILHRMRRSGSSYQSSTIRTHVTAHMFTDGTLLRTGPGRYRLARHRDRVDPPHPSAQLASDEVRVTEDQVKAAVAGWLENDGWEVEVRWGRERGIDILAVRAGQRWVIEAKGEAKPGPQHVNYFLGVLGELVQRMDDDQARYGLALPDHRQYRGLVERLLALARRRLTLDVFFADRDGNVELSTA